MQTLKERVDERESKPCAEQNIEKLAWDTFWEEWGPKLLLYACSYGSVDIVKLLVKDMLCSPNHQLYVHYVNLIVALFNTRLLIRCTSGETPLSCAAKAGKDDIVNFLLSLNEVSIPNSSEVCVGIMANGQSFTLDCYLHSALTPDSRGY